MTHWILVVGFDGESDGIDRQNLAGRQSSLSKLNDERAESTTNHPLICVQGQATSNSPHMFTILTNGPLLANQRTF